MSIPEKIFNNPFFHKLKYKILTPIDGTYNIKAINESIKNKKIIDIACGFGSPAFDKNLAKSYVGIDRSKKAVDYRNKNGDKCIQSDCCSIPFEDKNFDVALLISALHHLSKEKQMRAVKEAKRLANKVIILDHLKSTNKILSFMQMAYWKLLDGGACYNTKRKWCNIFNLLNLKILENDDKIQCVLFVLERDK